MRAILAVAALALAALPGGALAYSIEDVGAANIGDFVLEQAKLEITLNPGESATRRVMITNRTGRTQEFKIVTEDFVGTDDGSAAVRFLGEAAGPYSFRGNVIPEVTSFTLKQGERADIPVTVVAPASAAPGGYYTALIVSNVPERVPQGSGAQVISRVAQLIFTRVAGPVAESGRLRDFKLKPEQWVYGGGPYTFEILLQNDGNVHLAPYGTVTIRNVFGGEVGGAPVDAYYAMPRSMRYREILVEEKRLFGIYRAELVLHHGYKTRPDEISTASVWFVVLPWKVILAIVVAAFLLIVLARYVRRNFRLQRRRS